MFMSYKLASLLQTKNTVVNNWYSSKICYISDAYNVIFLSPLLDHLYICQIHAYLYNAIYASNTLTSSYDICWSL